MSQNPNLSPIHFDFIPYPLWRRKYPAFLGILAKPLFHRFYPVREDAHPPETPAAMSKWLARWKLLGGGDSSFIDQRAVARGLEDAEPVIAFANMDAEPQPAPEKPIRLPAQWEPLERVLISWAWLYPPLWEMHAQMAEGISGVCDVEILVTTEMWARAVWLYLSWRGFADMSRVKFLVLPTNDIWIRDYGPFVGLDENGQRVVINAIYDPLPLYPQALDDAMARRWAAHNGFPARDWHMHTEGGNVWSDGRGTLLMSEQIFYSNRYYRRDDILASLHSVFEFKKAIIIPRLTIEETGHIDLLVKLADSETILISAPQSLSTARALRRARWHLEHETNADGQHYRFFELPTPPLYLNWGLYPIRRAYTNALTVNGRVLVPTFDIPHDEEALRVYEQAMPDYEVIPIACKTAINGGGAVHCMTKEVPQARPKSN